jgi:hypothetical protein
LTRRRGLVRDISSSQDASDRRPLRNPVADENTKGPEPEFRAFPNGGGGSVPKPGRRVWTRPKPLHRNGKSDAQDAAHPDAHQPVLRSGHRSELCVPYACIDHAVGCQPLLSLA